MAVLIRLEYQLPPERYRSGHNGADSKSDGRVIPARGFESHPLRHFFSKSFPVLNAAPDFPTASLLPNSGDFGGRITINRARFVPAFTAEIRARASGISARAMGLLSIACLIA